MKRLDGHDCGCGGTPGEAAGMPRDLNDAVRRGFEVDVQGRRVDPRRKKREKCRCEEPCRCRERCRCHEHGSGEGRAGDSAYAHEPSSGFEGTSGVEHAVPTEAAPEPWTAIGSLPAGDEAADIEAPGSLEPGNDGRSPSNEDLPIGARPSVTPREVLPVRLVPRITFASGAPAVLLQCARELRSNPPLLRPGEDPRGQEARWLSRCTQAKSAVLGGFAYVVLPNGRYHAIPQPGQSGTGRWQVGLPTPPYLQPLPIPPSPGAYASPGTLPQTYQPWPGQLASPPGSLGDVPSPGTAPEQTTSADSPSDGSSSGESP